MKSLHVDRSKKSFLFTAAGILFLLLLPGINVDAQTQWGSGLVGGARLIKEEQSPFVSFSPVFGNGKTYVRWLVQNDEKDGLFIVERSADGIEFEALGFKDRVGSPLCVNLFYSFVDEEPLNGTGYYRVMAVSSDQTYSYSDVVRVRSDVPAAGSPSNTVLGE